MYSLLAQLKQEDVFKSISDNVGGTTDPKVFYVVALIGTGLVLLLVVINNLKKRQASPRAVNHQGKLLKEILKSLPLKKGEIKHLKTMAVEQRCASPLTLILCPSVLARGINAKGKADKRVVMGVARKMGILNKK
ncbi:MAG: hypothetical protein JWN40_5488 [Phycisphaerales bacterium]|nr:hypothetical protein [Phycisphaerales bacterium]